MMGTIVMSGEAHRAPIYMPDSETGPSWSGKSVYELNKAEIEAINGFATDEAWQMGYDDVCEGIKARGNPFHRGFLHGVPFALFALYYRRGSAAGNRKALGTDLGELFAA